MSSRLTLSESEQGMVSIIITLIIMGILTLIVVGFAQLARNEQRQALDNQLSTQAFYAAESGINEATKLIDSGAYTNDKTTCDADATFTAARSTINANNQVAYTCLLIDQSPEILEYSGIETDKSTVVPIRPVDSTNSNTPVSLSSLDISWNVADNSGSGYYSGGGFPPVSTWNNKEAGILRIDLTPVPNSPDFDRDTLSQKTFTAFLYPTNGGPTPTTIDFDDYSGTVAKQGGIQNINCGTPNPPYQSKKCKASITNLPTAQVDVYYLRMVSVYSNSAVTISGVTGSGPLKRQVSFKGAQYIIDATGKASDVIKRVRVHKPSKSNNYRYPFTALNSADTICKLLSIYPGPGGTAGGGTDGCPAASAVPATPNP